MRYSIEDFLEIRTASPSGFSADASKVLISSNLPGTSQLYRMPRTGGALEQVTDFEEPVGGTYLPSSDRILLQMDEGGNERLQIYLVVDDGDGLEKVVYEPEHIHRVGGVTRDGKAIAYASNRRNGVDFDIYVRSLVTGEEKRVFEMGGFCSATGFSPDGRLVGVHRLTERSGDNDVYLADVETGEIIHVSEHEEEASFGPPRWLPDSSAFFFSTDDEREFSAVFRYDMAHRQRKVVLEDEWDLSCFIDWPGRRLLVVTNEDGATRLEIFDPQSLKSLGEVPLPGRGVLASAQFSRDGRWLTYGYVSSTEPGDAWLYDTETGETTRLTTSPNPVSTEEFVEPELQRFTSSDGESIPVFLYMPADAEGPPPVAVSIHGGPESQYRPTFNPVIQYLLHRGYAVAAPNVRGSTGYGKRYHHLDDIEKRLDSVRDLAEMADWLEGTGRVDASRIVLMGGSYGGYMVLAGLSFYPDRWAAGVDIVGISSLVTFLENTSAWRRRFREREYGFLDKDREFLESASPLAHVEKIKAPLFIIHGTNDPRVPVTEAEQIYAELSGRGIPCELLVFADEGHGLSKLHNRLDAYPKAVDFLDRVLAEAGGSGG